MEMNTTLIYDKIKDDDSIISLLRDLSCYSNIFILATDIDISEINNYISKLISNRVRRPLITYNPVGDVVNTKEEIECILNSI